MLIFIRCDHCGSELFIDSGHVVPRNNEDIEDYVCDVCYDEWLLKHDDDTDIDLYTAEEYE